MSNVTILIPSLDLTESCCSTVLSSVVTNVVSSTMAFLRSPLISPVGSVALRM